MRWKENIGDCPAKLKHGSRLPLEKVGQECGTRQRKQTKQQKMEDQANLEEWPYWSGTAE
eukprot:11009495-Heterocapsa_arctica.AAC.2